ncbi:hypothetical protein ABBQ38_002001 [Trebouxia sp. C0009 RCD-2024]
MLARALSVGPEYTVVSEYEGEVSGDIAAVTPTRCRSDVCIAELKEKVQDAKLRQLPAAFTCFGQQVSVQPLSAKGSDTAPGTSTGCVTVAFAEASAATEGQG